MYIYYMESEIIQQLQIKPIPQKNEKTKIILSNIIEDKRGEQEDKELLKNVEQFTQVKYEEKPKSLERKNNLKKTEDKLILKKPKESKIKKTINVNVSIPATKEVLSITIGDEILKERLPKQGPSVLIQKSAYFMNNREIFIKFIKNLYQSYKDELLDTTKKITCENRTSQKVELFTHQKIIRDYINIYTPYRGLLMYHGLGSGKTCGSISIAEGILQTASISMVESLNSDRKVIVMTPASLRKNYFEELKKCGNPIYKKNQYWEFIDTEKEPENIDVLSSALNLSTEYIRKNNGAWLVNVKKKSNYETLSSTEKTKLDDQLNEMIHQKFQFINYNGLRKTKVNELTQNNTFNPFSHKVVIIDEAHNFISNIVNKIENDDLNEPKHHFITLYKNLLQAINCKVILLSGTPIINYPNEIGILFNILRGYIKTWNVDIEPDHSKSNDEIERVVKSFKHVDFVEYNSNRIKITRNPFGFVNTYDKSNYKGIKLNKQGDYLDDKEFYNALTKHLKKHNLRIKTYSVDNFKVLPDKLDEFKNLFIDSKDGDLKNTDILKRRIIGLTSYFRSAQEGLLPDFDIDNDYHVIKLPMSDYQFKLYDEIRIKERKQEKRKPMGKLYENTNSTYKIFSRAYCNFVFPDEMKRPFPNEGDQNEDNFDGVQEDTKNEDADDKITLDYNTRIKNAIKFLRENNEKYFTDELTQYSPKFNAILENLLNDEHKGCHLLYTQFRTLEGIEILAIILEANGFKQLKLKRGSSGEFTFNGPIEKDKMFALYTGSESEEEKEMIRNIYNGDWNYLPNSLSRQLKEINVNNNFGEIIKLFMITSSGAEGINLRNTRFVHITEPYWHPVRVEQVIGRARRICSHENLEKKYQNVKVFLYLMKFTDKQIEDGSKELKLQDKSKYDKGNTIPLTTDEALFEIMNRKENINKQILTTIKETAMDCSIHSSSTSDESLECYSFSGEKNPDIFALKPNIHDEEKDTKIKKLNIKTEVWKARKYTIDGKDYAMRMDENNKPTNMLYDIDSYKKALKNPNNEIDYIGKLKTKADGTKYIDSSKI
jgi:hypothetical protein